MTEIEKKAGEWLQNQSVDYGDLNQQAEKQLLQAFTAGVNANAFGSTPMKWVPFDFKKTETRPTESGKYLICRKDGKIHWETWNGSGWAYNHNEVRYWAVISPPSKHTNIFKLSFKDGRIDWCTAKNELHLLKAYDADFDLLLQEIEGLHSITEEEAKTTMVRNTEFDVNEPNDMPEEISIFDLAAGDEFAVIATTEFD